MITQVFTQNSMKIMTLFSLSPGSRLNRKMMKGKVFLNNVPLDNSLSRLVSSGIIKRKGNYYEIDFENSYSKKIIILCSKQFKQLKELPLRVYYMMIDLAYHFSINKGDELLLFGSYAKLTYTSKSDVDIAFLYEKPPDKKSINKLISKIKKGYSKNLEMHYFDKKRFYKNKKDPLVRSIIKDGVKII